MLKISKIKFILTLQFLILYDVNCFYDDQPKFILNKGNLIIQSAKDKNITIRLVGNGHLLANDIDILKNSNRRNSYYPLPPLPRYTTPSIIRNNDEIRNLLSELQRNVSRIANSSSTYPIRLRRINLRINSINRRINTMLRKLQTNKCDMIPCKNGGSCIPIYDSYKCHCTNNWQGETCEIDVDECATFIGTDLGCQNGAWCQNIPGSYRCQCSNGFHGTHCTQRTVDCLKSPPGEICGHGVCVPAKNDFGYQCICEQGWTTNGITPACTYDVDECETTKNHCQSTCINLPGSFKCGPCPQGYTGNGLVCRDINECDNNNGGCSTAPQVNCINTEGSSHCGPCPPGWSGDGRYCSRTDVNNCPADNLCYDKSRCQYISGQMTCTCPPGMRGHGIGMGGCTGGGNPCENPNPCRNGGTCIRNGASYTCLCLDGFDSKTNCTAKNLCIPNPCHNGGTCTTVGSFFSCTCPPGISGTTCLESRTRCGGVLSEETGVLQYLNYQRNRRCAWLIKTHHAKILNITFTKFDLENNTDCTSDWLQIHDGRSSASPLIGRFCGNILPRGGQIYTSHNQIYLWFRSDNSNDTKEGFELNWKTINPICGGVFNITANEHNGIIKSPGYPGKSPPNRDCSWEFIGPYGKKFEFRFFEISLGSTAQECDDFLEITDSGDSLVKICNSGLPQPKKSASNMVSVNFHTNKFGFDSAFQLHYEIVDGQPGCGGYYNNSEGTITSPTEESAVVQSAICWYLIKQPIGTYIRLEFTKFELATFFDCSLQSLEVYDGMRDSEPLIGRYCGEVAPNNITSNSNYLLIKYKYVDNFVHSLYSGFEAKYKLNCDATYRNATGIIESPGYPNPYYKDIDCIYKIFAPLHNLISLRIEHFSLSKENECNMAVDNLEIYNDMYKPDRYCSPPSSIIVSKTSHLQLVFHSIINQFNASGFRISYKFDEISCGGVLTEPNGTITTDNIPTISTSAIRFCEWIILAPSEYNIDLNFEEFDLGDNNCSNSLSLFMNTSKVERQIGQKACNVKAPVSSIYAANILSLILAKGTILPKGFTANYKFIDSRENCGGNFSAPYGSFQSPKYPEEYPDYLDCTWIIHAPLGHQIELIPKNFSLENTTMRCSEDYLEIRNGMTANSPLIGLFCGDNIPQRIPSFTNHLYIHFHTDWSITETGFKIEWEQTMTGCGGTLNSYQGSIHSPHYPDIMNDAAQCDWYITTSAGSRIAFNITSISNLDLCKNNQLFIYDGPNAWYNRIKLNCTMYDNMILAESTSNKLFVRFVITANDKTNFLLEYVTNCHTHLHDLHGVIESPNFPYDYPDDLECAWRISGKKSKKIKLIFSHLQLEGDTLQCPYDTLIVSHILNNEEIYNQTLCRDKPYLLTSRGDEFLIKFETDFSNGAKGFRMEYQIDGCGKHFYGDSGYISSPNYPYSLNVYCLWIIEAEYGSSVELKITSFYIDPDNRDCKLNSLTISNDKDETHPIVTACNVAPTVVTSSGRMMYIHFETDSFHSKKYFNATFRVKKTSCGGVIDAKNADIISPNYPDDYPIDLNCEWHIKTESQHHFQLSFVTFDIEQSDNCTNDVVEIYDGENKTANNLVLRHCGGNLPLENLFKSSANHMLVIFKTNNATQKPGWKLNILRNCGSDLTQDIGFIKKEFSENDCIWKIKSPNEASRIYLTFQHVECNCSSNMSPLVCEMSNGVKIYDGDSEEAPLSTSFCIHHPIPLASNGRSLTIVAKSVSFDAYFTQFDRFCGGYLSSLRGRFASPLYPNSYPANIECLWTIKIQDGNFIDLTFSTLDIVKSDECNDDYVEVRNTNATGKVLAILCGNEASKSYRAYQSVWVKFRSNSESVAKGFLASYNYVTENELTTEYTNDFGTIRPPPIMSMRGESNPFKWRIMVSDDKVVELRFNEYSQGLTLFDGFDENAYIIALEHSPLVITSSSNTAYLVADNNILHDFVITWKGILKDSLEINDTTKECLQTLLIAANDTGTNISSINFPNGYENGIDCEYILKPENPSTHVQLHLYAADLESFPSCDADNLIISSSRNLISWKEEKKVCFLKLSDKPHFTVEGTPNLKVNFHTDGSVIGTGFLALVDTKCGGYLTESVGIFDAESVNIETDLRVKECLWQIEIRSGRKIEFEFEFEENDNEEPTSANEPCQDYFVLIRDGIDEDAPILKPGRICTENHLNKSTLVTTSNRAYVKFHFGRIKKAPYTVTYREHIDCGSEIHLTNFMNTTNITTPHYPNIPNPYSECIWTFIAPPGQVVEVKFIDNFEFAYGAICPSEYLELRDGSTSFSREIGTFCRKPHDVQRSTGNVLFMKFVADVAEPKNGFRAIVSLSKCGGTIAGGYSGIMKSENYPLPGGYRSNSFCEYTIKVPSFYRLNLTIQDINLPYNSQNLNESDHIMIYSISDSLNSRYQELVTTIWGNNSMNYLEIDSNELVLKFITYKANTQYRGFKIGYNRVLGRCFKNVESENGELVMPRPVGKSTYISCRWKIRVPKGRSVSAQIVDLQFSGNRTDSSHRITFYNDFAMLSRISSVTNNTSEVFKSTDNTMLIRIYGGYRATLTILRIKYNSLEISKCPDDITSETGVITSPVNLTDNNYYCRSSLSLNDFQTMGYHIKNYLLTSSGYIQSPGVRIKTGVGSYWSFLDLKLNTTNTNIGISAKSSIIEIVQTDYSKIFAFDMSYKKHNCGGVIAIEDLPINITKFNDNYGRLDCAWEIKVQSIDEYNITINVNFTNPCSQEFLAIHSGQFPSEPKVKTLCGSNKENATFNYTLQNRYVYLYYHADEYSSKSTYEINSVQLNKCGGILKTRYYEKILQFNPNDYKNNLECIWDFKGKSGFSVAVQFYERFFIENSNNCTKDYLLIKTEQANKDWYQYPKFCGRNIPNIINTTSQNLQIIFRSDDSTTGDGFSLRFTQICGGIYNVTNKYQRIESPSDWNPYSYHIKCNYTLVTDSNDFINVKFKHFDIESSVSEECRYSKMHVFKPSSEDENEPTLVGTYCKKDSLTEIRSRKFITIIFDASFEAGSYSFDYYLEECGGIINTPMSIHSPYGEDGTVYPHNMDCVWNITAPVDNEIIIKFKYIDMERGFECKYDYVNVFTGWEETLENRKISICGNMTMRKSAPEVKISNNKAIVVSRSDEYIAGKGFSAEIRFTKKCDKHIQYTHSNLPDTHYELDYYKPDGYENFLDCHILFTIVDGYQLQIEFEDFNVKPCSGRVPNETTCDCDYLEIFDSNNIHSGSVGKYCGTMVPGIFQSSQQSLLLRFVTDNDINGRGFKALIKHKVSQCGVERIDLNSGQEKTIHSPNFGISSYPANIYCKWIVNASDSFIVHFEKMELEEISNGKCLDYIEFSYTEIYEGKTSHKYCGNTIPNDVTFFKKSYMFENTIVEIFFKTNGLIQKSGFNITLKASTSACNSTFTQLSGSIRHQKIPSKCAFNFVVPEHYTLSFFIPALYDFGLGENCTQSIKFYEKDTNKLLKTTCADRLHSSKQIFLKTHKVYVEAVSENGKDLYLDMFYMANDNGLGCGGKTYELSGTFSSPMYPDNFRNYTTCRWEIEVSTNNIIAIRFLDFNMGAKINCPNDYLQIIDIGLDGTETVSQQYCGEDNPEMFRSKGSKVAVVYKRTVNFDGKGWQIAYSADNDQYAGQIIL